MQISDSHIGFNKAAIPGVSGTLEAAIDKVNALPVSPSFILHTGDITQLSKPEEFDTATQILKKLKSDQIFFVPGEHDVLDGTGKLYRERHGMNSVGDGWYSANLKGASDIDPSGWNKNRETGVITNSRNVLARRHDWPEDFLCASSLT